MAHNIAMNQVTGKHMVFTAIGKNGLPWHSLGQNAQDAQSWRETMALAELGWKVVEAPLYTQWQKAGTVKVDGFKAVVRADTKQTLGIHKLGYKIFQNEQAFEMCDALLEQGARYESAGALGNGEKIWCLARIPQADFSLGGDKHEAYLLVATSHDGSLATTVTVTFVRVVCNNTLTAALSAAKSGNTLKIRHTKSADSKIEQAKQMISGTVITADTLKSKLATLAQRKIKREHAEVIFDRLFPVTDSESSQTRRNNILSDILAKFELNDNNAFPEQRGTAYALLNAITDYTDHARSTRTTGNESANVARSESALFGSGAQLKSKALDTIYAFTNDDLEAMVAL